jgi:hypothetical protein
MVAGAMVIAVLLSVGTTASPTYTPSITPHPSPSPTESPTLPSRTPTNTPQSATRTPTKTLSLNTFFAGRIETLRFFSDSLVIQRGCSKVGRVTVSTLYGGETPTYLFSEALIDGECPCMDRDPMTNSFPSCRLISHSRPENTVFGLLRSRPNIEPPGPTCRSATTGVLYEQGE